MMAKYRLDRISEEIKKEVSDIIRNELKDPRVSTLCSVVLAQATPDLKSAKIYVSILGDESEKEETYKGLKSAAGFIRKELSERLNLRYTPELVFEIDKSIEHGANISRILNEIKRKEEGESH